MSIHAVPGSASRLAGTGGTGEIMRLVILESPYSGNIWQRFLNRRYARKCMKDCLLRNESPIASHLLYTQPGVLRDHDPEDRKLGIAAGHAWTALADAVVVYTDRGISRGMEEGIKSAYKYQIPVEHRTLGDHDND